MGTRDLAARRPLLRGLGRGVLPTGQMSAAGELRGLSAEVETIHDVGEAAREWLLHNIHQTEGGISDQFHRVQGWAPASPSVTGSTITTLLSMESEAGDVLAGRRARELGDWLLKRQHSDGTWEAGPETTSCSVFVTAQVLNGLTSLFRADGNRKVHQSAARAASFLIGSQGADGFWLRKTRDETEQMPHAQAAWALGRWGMLTHDVRACQAAEQFLERAVELLRIDGWSGRPSWKARKSRPWLTRSLAYSVEGLIEGGWCVTSLRAFEAGRTVAGIMSTAFRQEGKLGGSFDPDWQPADWECLTGTAQMARCWGRLADLTEGSEWIEAMEGTLVRVAGALRLGDSRRELRGAVKGTAPQAIVQGADAYPSEAVKFFLDGMLIRDRLMAGTCGQIEPPSLLLEEVEV